MLLAAAMAVAGYVRTAVSPLQEAMRVALELTDNQMALLQGPVIGIPVALTAIPLGLLIDRWLRVRLLMAFILLSAAGTLLTALTSSFGLLLFARGLAGVAGLAVLPVVFSLLADHYPPAQRGRATTAAVVGQVVGNSAAFALGGALLAMAPDGPQSWRWAMLWMAAPLIPVLLSMPALREPVRTGLAIQNPSAGQVLSELREYGPVILPLALGIILVETAVGAMLIWSAPMLSRRFALPPDDVGTIMAIGMMVSGVAGPIIGGALADYCQRTGGPRRTVNVLAILALLGAPTSLFAFVPGAAITSILLVSAMTLMLAVAIMGMALFTVVIPNELRGLCLSLLMAGILLFALAVAPIAVSLLSEAIGGLATIGKALSIVCMVAGVLSAVTFAFGARFFPRGICNSG